jgi:hypothetical protein
MFIKRERQHVDGALAGWIFRAAAAELVPAAGF